MANQVTKDFDYLVIEGLGTFKPSGSGGGGAVDSVNGKTGVVVLDASDVGALPDDTPIPSAVTEQTVIGWGFTKNAVRYDEQMALTDTQKATARTNVGAGTYSKPSGGIPKSDLASAVQTSLGKADTALQQHQSLAGYATESYVQNAIAAIPDELPTVTAADNGKVLGVVNGAWAKKADDGGSSVIVDSSLSIEGAAADAKATGDEIGDLKSALFNDEGTNLITSSTIRNSAGSGSNYITIDKTKLTMLWRLQISGTTDTSAITLSSNPLNLNTNKEYVFFAHLKSLSDNNVSQGAIGVQYLVGGQTPQAVTSAYALRFAQVMDGYVRGVFKPNRTTGYIRFVFNGMASGAKVVNLMVDQLYFGEMPAGYAPSEVYGAIKNLNNHVDKLYMTKDADCINADLICWGDSLTAGAGGNGITYPDVCASELGLSVLNCGVGGEDCNTIAARQGGNNVVIPAGHVNGTYAHLYDIFGYELTPLLQGDGNNSGREIIVNGLNCQLVRSSGNYVISGYNGDALSVPTLARFAGSDFTGKIVTIWIGTNGGSFPGTSAGIDMRIAWINSMIKHIGHERYVILGLTVGEETASFYINEENRMKQAFGNKYFPTRKYLIESGLTIAGITPTSQDETDIAAGKVPTSLKSDSTHLNASGYTAVGKLLANKIRSLGYV